MRDTSGFFDSACGSAQNDSIDIRYEGELGGSVAASRRCPRAQKRDPFGYARGRRWAPASVRRKLRAVWVTCGASESFAQQRAQDDTV